MIDHAVLLDGKADTFPDGLAGTPFEVVYLALRMVAADVWDVDPRAYRAAIAWGWYLTHRPADLAGFRDLLCNALVSEAAPLVKPTQTVDELIGYLRAWREYKPTYGQLESLYSFFAASAEIQPVEGERFFYICISGIDWSRPLTYDEAFAIAQRATPLGAFFNIYFRYEDEIQIPVRCADYIGFAYRIGDDYELSRPTGSADQTLELLLGMRSSGSGTNAWQSVTYSTTSGYWGGIISEADRKTAEEFGLQVHTNKWAGTIGGILNDYTYSIEMLAVYSDMGETPVTAGDTWFFRNGTTPDASLVYMVIANSAGFSTSVKSYKARFTKRSETFINLYFNADKSEETLVDTSFYTLYDEFGKRVWYDPGKRYTLIGLYNGEESLGLKGRISTTNYATPRYSLLRFGSANAVATHAVCKVEDIQNRVAYFNNSGTDYSYNAGTHNMYAIIESPGNTFIENFERVLDIVRIETADGTAIDESIVNNTKLQSSGSAQLLQFARYNSSVSFTAARVIYRSYPPSMFPTITTGGDFSTYNWLTVSSGSPETINGGENSTDLSYSGVTPNYDSTKQYAVSIWRESSSVNSGYGQFTIINSGGKLRAHNNTNQALTFYTAQVAVCHSTDAVVVTVYNSSNKPYSAFRVQVDGKYFYSILSGSVSAWTSRIESLGYHL